MTYDSRADTLIHARRVGALIIEMVNELLARAISHDASKIEDPEKEIFDEYTPKLKHSTYGSEEYKGFLKGMGDALQHHYEHNRHHPEWGEQDLAWQPIAGFEGQYEISNLGDVKSLARKIERPGSPRGDLNLYKERILKLQITPKGYLRVQLQSGEVITNRLVHRLVAGAFLPKPIESEMQINHRDGNKKNNRFDNLEWVTPSENLQHAYDIGLHEPAVKYVVFCPELNLLTFGTEPMARELVARGFPASHGGVYGAMIREGLHCGLHFEGTNIAEWRRSRLEKMNLVDLIEMLCDWKAAGERHADGSLSRSLEVQKERFGISDQLAQILKNTAHTFGLL